jgi:hypothetical protein
LVERIGSVDVDGQRAAADKGGDFSIVRVDVLAGCFAESVIGPEAVVADVAVDQVVSHGERGRLSA